MYHAANGKWMFQIKPFKMLSPTGLDRPITFIYELDPYPLKIYLQTENELATTKLSKIIVLLQTYRYTDTHTCTYNKKHEDRRH